MTEAFRGNELTRADLEGFCLGVQVSGSLPVALPVKSGPLSGPPNVSGTGLLLGVPALKLQNEATSDLAQLLMIVGCGPLMGVQSQLERAYPRASSLFESSAKAVLLTVGKVAGLPGAGATAGVGYVWTGGAPPKPVPPPVPGPEHFVEKIVTNPREKVLIIAGDALFHFNEDKIRPEAEVVLRMADVVIKSKPGSSLYLEGHTDSVGDVAYNLGLSCRRAASVARWFVKNKSVAAHKVVWTGFGKSRPVASNNTSGGRARNRRVEIRIVR